MLKLSCENAGQLRLFGDISLLNTRKRKYRRPYNMKQITLLLLAIFFTINASAQGLSKYLPALNASIETINSSKDTNDFKDLEIIGRLLQSRKVIGLGEATHGTQEHVIFKARLIKYLILKHNLRRVAFESEMIGTDRVNQFVLNPEDKSSLKSILKGSMMSDVFISKELTELISWIKDYNKDKSAIEKVHFEGMDMQYPANAANKILNTPKLLSLLNEAEKRSLKEYAQVFKTDLFALVPEELLKRITLVNETLATRIENFSTRDSTSIYTQYNTLLRQSIKMRNKSMFLQGYYRDRFMADNTEWIADQTLQHQKIAVWAHNGHISEGLTAKRMAMGNWLKRKFKGRYYALALLAGEGYARLYEDERKINGLTKVALPPLSNLNSLESVFSKAKYENFFFDIRKASESNDLKDFFKEDLYIRTMGPMLFPLVDIKINLKNSFDGLLYFRKTNAVTSN